MHIVYHCRDGLINSPLAAGIHLGLLDPAHVPSEGELRALPFYGRSNHVRGRLYPAGTDEKGNNVYTLGRSNAAPFVIKLLSTAVSALFDRDDVLVFFDCDVPGGGLLSSIKCLGRNRKMSYGWAVKLASCEYFRLVQVVQNVRTGLYS